MRVSSSNLSKTLVVISTLITAMSTACATAPDFGPNVKIFDPSIPIANIQAFSDALYATQETNEMGNERYAILFKPGTYGSSDNPLIVKAGYYTEVAGLGALPSDVIINGHVDSYNQCRDGYCNALNNFWRSLSNLTINVMGGAGCYSSANFWAISQAAPIRRVQINGTLTFMDYCSPPNQFASGGFAADIQVSNETINGSQQQFLIRNSNISKWSNGILNQVFSGIIGAPDHSFGLLNPDGTNKDPYTVIAQSPVTREKPFLYIDPHGDYQVFVPNIQTNSSGISWNDATPSGKNIPISAFYIAKPGDTAQTLNQALKTGKHLLLTPGIYKLNASLQITAPNTIVLGLGMATLVPTRGNLAVKVNEVPGVILAGVMVDANAIKSPILISVGEIGVGQSDPNNPTTLSDVFIRVGGARIGKTKVAMEINSDNVILDNIWSWRADHGIPRTWGWTNSTSDHGLIVNGNNVIGYGLFVEHHQRHNLIWNGENGKVFLFQNELAYDVPNQASWMDGNKKGFAAYKVSDTVQNHQAWGLGSYVYFNINPSIHVENAIEVPKTPGIKLNSMVTVSIKGNGVIEHIVNGVGPTASGTPGVANTTKPFTLKAYP